MISRRQAILALLTAPAAAVAQMPQQQAAVIGVPPIPHPAPIINIGLGEQIPEFTNAAWIAGIQVEHLGQTKLITADEIWAALTDEQPWRGRRAA